MSFFPRVIYEKHCYIPCPPEQCNCRSGNPIEWELQQVRFDMPIKGSTKIMPTTPSQKLPQESMMISGYKIIVSHPAPKMRLAENVCVTDEFRAEMNQWMAGFFGYIETVQKGESIVMKELNTIVMHPDDYNELRLMKAANLI